jgi:hypothetical protein
MTKREGKQRATIVQNSFTRITWRPPPLSAEADPEILFLTIPEDGFAHWTHQSHPASQADNAWLSQYILTVSRNETKLLQEK